MGYKDFLYNLIPPSYNRDGEVFQVFLGAIGAAIDQYNPEVINLKSEFSVTNATGPALDRQGADWGVSRRDAEVDTPYRQRILSILPIYVNGPTVAGVQAVVKPFTGTNPDIFEYGPGAFTIGESAIGEAGFSTETDVFNFEVHINNPGAISYNHLDMENAIRKIKMARSTAILYHNGTDTSPLGEGPNDVITIVS